MFITNLTRSWLLLTVLDLATTQQNQTIKTCNITQDIVGECVLIENCPRAMDLLKLNDRKSLHALNCGFESVHSKVCCVTNKTDGPSITFKNTTQDIATSKPEVDLSSSVKVSLDPVATFPYTTPTVAYSTTPRVYSTTMPITTHPPKKTNTTHQNREPPFGIFVPPATRPTLISAPPFAPSASTETTPTFDNHLGADAFIPNKSAQEEAPSEVTPSLPDKNIGTTETVYSVPNVQHLDYLLPSRSVCGLLATDRIYGGQLAGLDELPWLARIKYLVDSREVYACHASLITDRFLVTAAHCILVPYKIIEVRLGEWDAETDQDCDGGECSDPPQDIKVNETYVHPTYNLSTRVGDIGILRLEKPAYISDFVRPICLPTTDSTSRVDYDLDNVYLTGGWGKTEYESRPVVKRKINLKAVPMETCRAALRWASVELASSSICAGGRKGEDTCSGDSGGPLAKRAMENRQVNWFLYGVTSYGSNRCGSEGMPGIYTRITYYMDWIMGVLAASN